SHQPPVIFRRTLPHVILVAQASRLWGQRASCPLIRASQKAQASNASPVEDSPWRAHAPTPAHARQLERRSPRRAPSVAAVCDRRKMFASPLPTPLLRCFFIERSTLGVERWALGIWL